MWNRIINWFKAEDIKSQMGANIIASFFRILVFISLLSVLLMELIKRW